MDMFHPTKNQKKGLTSFGYAFRNGLVDLFLIIWVIIGYTNLHSYQQCSLFSVPSPTLLHFGFLIIAIWQMGQSISFCFWLAFSLWLMTLTFFIYLLAICVFLRKIPMQIFCLFLIKLSVSQRGIYTVLFIAT